MSDTQMMKLARAMGKEVNSRGCVLDEWYDDDLGEEVYGFITFDPANNDAQAIDVLCWLLNTDPIAHWELTTDGKQTPPSLRAAILAAALRVVGE